MRVSILGEPACECVYVWVCVLNLQRAGRNSSGGEVEEGDSAHQHHSALVPSITSLCFTASLHNNYPACSFEGIRPSLLISHSNGQALLSATSLDVQRTLVGGPLN